jgi:hypothetical protein
MRHRHGHGCGHRGRIEFSVPEALFAMRAGRGGHWGPFNFEFDESGFGVVAAAVGAGSSSPASFASSC